MVSFTLFSGKSGRKQKSGKGPSSLAPRTICFRTKVLFWSLGISFSLHCGIPNTKNPRNYSEKIINNNRIPVIIFVSSVLDLHKRQRLKTLVVKITLANFKPNIKHKYLGFLKHYYNFIIYTLCVCKFLNIERIQNFV